MLKNRICFQNMGFWLGLINFFREYFEVIINVDYIIFVQGFLDKFYLNLFYYFRIGENKLGKSLVIERVLVVQGLLYILKLMLFFSVIIM